jgi:hypothetical protein
MQKGFSPFFLLASEPTIGLFDIVTNFLEIQASLFIHQISLHMVVLSTCLLLGDQPVLLVYFDHLLELMIILVALQGLCLPGLPM